jgi:enoyl-CoA hydratase/carnithine racemase
VIHSSPLLIEHRSGGVTLLTLNNQDRRNALDPPLAQALLDVVPVLIADPSVRCVVITGAGRAFCSGADLAGLRADASGGLLQLREKLGNFYNVFLGIRELPMPVIGAINGGAIGAGLNLALCCDVRIAGRSAKFGATFVHLGIHPGGGATYLLTRLVGPGVAAELLLSGTIVDAEKALSMRLVNQIVDDSEVVKSALALAATIAANSQQAVRATKRTLAVAIDASFAATLEVETLTQAITQGTEDAVEGWTAFQQRRAPRFGA